MAVWSLEKGNLKLQEYKNLTYLQESIRIMRSALSQFGYHFFLTTRPDSIAISFNGENQYRLEHHLPRRPIRALYVKGPNPFPEVEEFIEKCKRDLPLNLETYLGNQKDVLRIFLDSNPITKSIIIGFSSLTAGTRRTDPYSENLRAFQETDGDWPRMMRIHPMLDWTFENVWDVIFKLDIPYCILYERGYTSLGDISNTRPNPKLLLPDGSFAPAYKLQDGKDERLGRIKK